jgi:hypothetical protein
MKPFLYLKSTCVEDKWKAKLKKLSEEIECGYLTREKLKLRIYDIIRGIERLETLSAFLEDDLTVEKYEIEKAKKILETIRHVIDDRYALINEIL